MKSGFKFLTVVFFLVGFIFLADCNAQYSFATDNLLIGQVFFHKTHGTIDENSVFLRQAGYQNQAIVQQRSGIDGANLATIKQTGLFQLASLSQSGSNNKANLRQSGVKNVLDIAQNGSYNRTNVFQVGVGNMLSEDIVGDNLNYTVFQFGNNWGLTIIGTPGIPGITVEQTGMAGTPVTIQHH